MGNIYTMRPDLFGAIHCAVPLLYVLVNWKDIVANSSYVLGT